MASNTWGKHFRLTTFGESHGPAIGGVIDGCPSNFVIDTNAIQHQLNRRRPNQNDWVTARNEADEVEFLSGIFEGKTTGSPIGFVIKNNDQHSKDYDQIKEAYRPGHADYVYEAKYGHRDHRGGGRSSARETACRVVAGEIARQILAAQSIQARAYVSSIKDCWIPKNHAFLDLTKIDSSPVRCPDENTSNRMIQLIAQAKENQDSLGGIITCVIENVPVGWGSPIYEKLNAQLAHGVFSLNAVKGFEMGDGFSSTLKWGSQNNDAVMGGSNNDGGITGGISNGKDIWFKVAFKPTSSIGKSQQTINSKKEKIEISLEGRHDPCVVIRAVPIIEAIAYFTLLNSYFENKIESI